MRKVIDRGKRSKTLIEVKPVENISKNLESFLMGDKLNEKLCEILSQKIYVGDKLNEKFVKYCLKKFF